MIALLLPLLAFASDTTALAEQRQKDLAKIPFWCAVGRNPIASSFDALSVKPSADCRFSGPLDTKRDPLTLEPPFLNPRFGLNELREVLRAEGTDLGNGSFRLGSETFRASVVDETKLKDPLFHFHGHPPEWGTQFLTIKADRNLEAFTALGARHPEIFWANPYFKAEQSVLPRLLAPGREHLPLNLLSKCAPLGELPKLLFVGDYHRGPDSVYFNSVLAQHHFAFAALEVNQDKQPFLDAFLTAATPADEDRALGVLTDNVPKEMIEPFHAIYRTLKNQHVPVVLIDYAQAYFNFPYTNTAFHGLPITMRNQLWISRLPASWDGTGVLFAGRDHFLDLPGADLQNFAAERFPGVSMALVNPLETCP